MAVLLDVFSNRLEVKMFVGIVRNIVFFMSWKKPGTYGFTNLILRHTGSQIFKNPRNPEELDP
jgi:hypothetical protein